jgi:repressor LexA
MSQRTEEILAFIKRHTRERGFPPTIREIGREFGISSTNGVRYHLSLLEKQGLVAHKDRLSRGIYAVETDAEIQGIPIIGDVAAGQPILAEERLEGHLPLNEVFGDPNGLFALRVRGDSMIDAGIMEGDYVLVRSQKTADAGEMVVALVGNEATVKYYRPRGETIELVAANENYAPIVMDGSEPFELAGVVRGVVRTVGR